MPAWASIEDGADDGGAQGDHEGPAGAVDEGDTGGEVSDSGHGVPGHWMASRSCPQGDPPGTGRSSPRRPAAASTAGPGVRAVSYTHLHPTYRKGDGPGVIVIHEMPGLTRGVVRFAEEVVAAGYTVCLLYTSRCV